MKAASAGRALCVSALLGMVATSSAPAGLVGQQSLSTLANSADAIVVGSASGALRAGTPGAFSLQVLRVVEGPVPLAGANLLVQ